MSGSVGLENLTTAGNVVLNELIEQYAERLKKGETLDVDQCVREHSEHAEQLRKLLPTMQVLAELGQSVSADKAAESVGLAADDRASGTLGDFRILREIGRGGMGVVYEAHQISLSRRVALKVLPFAATFDPRQLQRFHNEARAAACLHHPHIVAVYAVGCERAVNFYAMQFIDGQALDSLLVEMRRGNKPAPREPAAEQPGPTSEAPKRETVLEVRAEASTLASMGKGGDYFRRVAEMTIQAAEALEHAHACGVVHRDVKPGNLMLDERGKLWVTDFGLAQIQTDARVTLTGDLVGTLRYMSPEQALAKRVVVDHRTDIYSLGATLYEFLTLKPVFAGGDRQELLRQIAFEEPVAPRRHHKAVPPDMETIVLKALQKNPAERYATAQDLAEDLKRFVKDEPIKAKRPSLNRRFGKWCRRHRLFVSSAAAAIFVGLVALTAGLLWHRDNQADAARKAAIAQTAIRIALDQAEQSRQDLHAILKKPRGVFELLNAPARWQALVQAAQAHLDRAQALVSNSGEGIDSELSKRAAGQQALLRQDEANRLLALRLERIRMDRAVLVDGKFDKLTAAREYPKAFAEGGFLVSKEQPAAIAARVGASPINEQLVAALDDWAWVAFRLEEKGVSEQVLEIGRLASPDPVWGGKLRQIAVWRDQNALIQLVKAAPPSGLSPPLLDLIGNLVGEKRPLRELWFRQAQAQFPADFWLNYDMARAISKTHPEEAIGFLRAAIAIRPGSSAAYNSLGIALYHQKKPAEAIAAYQKAIELDPNYPNAYVNFGVALSDQKKPAEAIAAYQKAIELDPKLGVAYNNLSKVLREQKKVPEAIAALQKAIELEPEKSAYYSNLGLALRTQKLLPEAIAAFRKAIDLDPDSASAYHSLGQALLDQDKPLEAISAQQKAIELDPKYAIAYTSLGVALHKLKKLPEAIAAYQKAIELDPKSANAYYNLGNALGYLKKLPEAIAAYQKAIELDPKYACAYYNLGNALCDLKKLPEAIAAYQKAIQIDANDLRFYNNLGVTLGELKKLPEAIVAYQRAIELNPKNAKMYNTLGLALQGQKKLPEAISAYERAIELDASYAKAYYNLGSALRDQKKLPEAIDAYKKAIEVDPSYAQAHNNLGVALYNQQKFSQAMAAFQKAIELDPKHDKAYFNLGNALGAQQKLPEAIAAYQRAVELNPKNAEMYNNLGTALREQKKLPEALNAFQKSIELDPKYATAYYNQGLTLGIHQKLPEAVAAFQKTIELAPKDANLHRRVAWSLATLPELKDYDPALAVEVAKKAVEMNHEEAIYWKTLGAAYYRAGDWQAALAALEKAMALRTVGNAGDWFFLAMTHWQLGDKVEARKWYDRAVEWMEKNNSQDEEFRWFRAEAAELMGVKLPGLPRAEYQHRKTGVSSVFGAQNHELLL